MQVQEKRGDRTKTELEEAVRNYNGLVPFQKEIVRNNTTYLRIICPQCRKEVDRDDNFCPNCGMRFLWSRATWRKRIVI